LKSRGYINPVPEQNRNTLDGAQKQVQKKNIEGTNDLRRNRNMQVSVRDLASAATIGLFLTTLFTWAEILKVAS
jgi:hypothetical protein